MSRSQGFHIIYFLSICLLLISFKNICCQEQSNQNIPESPASSVNAGNSQNTQETADQQKAPVQDVVTNADKQLNEASQHERSPEEIEPTKTDGNPSDSQKPLSQNSDSNNEANAEPNPPIMDVQRDVGNDPPAAQRVVQNIPKTPTNEDPNRAGASDTMRQPQNQAPPPTHREPPPPPRREPPPPPHREPPPPSRREPPPQREPLSPPHRHTMDDESPDVFNEVRHQRAHQEQPRRVQFDEPFAPSRHPPFIPNDFSDDDEPNVNDFVYFTALVGAGKKECYYYTSIVDFEVTYQVVSGDGLDIGVVVALLDGRIIESRPPMSDGTVKIRVSPSHSRTTYMICLDNRKATFAEKYVYFAIDVMIDWENPSPHELSIMTALRKKMMGGLIPEELNEEMSQEMEQVKVKLDRLSGRMRIWVILQQRLKNFDATDLALLEDNLQLVNTRSILQVVILCSVALLQVLVIRAFFDSNSRLYSLWYGKTSRKNVAY